MSFQLNAELIFNLKLALRQTDDIAFANVTQDEQGKSILDGRGNPIPGQFPRGGPFGAAVAISYKDGDFEIIGTPRGNNVVGSGIASRHAEDQALLSDNYEALVVKLKKSADRDPTVWMISSGQSCTTCHTKQEIAARDFIEQGLIKPGHFATLYGATYDETLEIAQFYDAQYADAMILRAQRPDDAGNLIHHQKLSFADTPTDVQAILGKALAATAVVMRNGLVYAIGCDARNSFDPYQTAEVNAVRAACVRNREEGAFASWEVDGTLYATSKEIGPLLYAEAGWTKISNVVSVQLPPELQKQQFISQEAAGVSNQNFLRIVAEGYQSSDAAIRVFRDKGFINRGQPMWARVLEANQQILYNGASVSDAVLAMRDVHTRFRFAAHDIREWHRQANQPPKSPEPLRQLLSHTRN